MCLHQKWLQQGLFYRVCSGPFSTRTEAENAMNQLQAYSLLKPIIVAR